MHLIIITRPVKEIVANQITIVMVCDNARNQDGVQDKHAEDRNDF